MIPRMILRRAPLLLALLGALLRAGEAPCAVVPEEWGGHLRMQGSVSDYPRSHAISGERGAGRAGDAEPFLDGGANFRLTSRFSLTDNLSLTVHYEAEMAGGDTRSAASALASPPPSGLVPPPPSDDHQLFSLTKVLEETPSGILYHRLDRLALTYAGDTATFKFGRQALTWGNGLIFNPMDLLNPFSPADVIRDYKVGADMALFQTFGETVTDFQTVWVPRRNPDTDRVSSEASSFAAKARFSARELDWDLMAGRHFDETVIGAGITGYAGDAAWRADALWTRLRSGGDYVTAVINIDYSWTWQDHNWYGLLEGYFNSLGDGDTLRAAADPDLSTRISRGEVFTTGRWYVAGQLRWEAHPLLNLYASVIWNLEDGSALLQPRMIWDARDSLRILMGLDLPAGNTDSEFGGTKIPGTDRQGGPPSRIYLQATLFF